MLRVCVAAEKVLASVEQWCRAKGTESFPKVVIMPCVYLKRSGFGSFDARMLKEKGTHDSPRFMNIICAGFLLLYQDSVLHNIPLVQAYRTGKFVCSAGLVNKSSPR